jgi:hypothetical protein
MGVGILPNLVQPHELLCDDSSTIVPDSFTYWPELANSKIPTQSGRFGCFFHLSVFDLQLSIEYPGPVGTVNLLVG